MALFFVSMAVLLLKRNRRSNMLLQNRRGNLCCVGRILVSARKDKENILEQKHTNTQAITNSPLMGVESWRGKLGRDLVSVRLVSSDGLATVEIAVDTGVDLVQEIGLMRTGSVGCGTSGVGVGEASGVASIVTSVVTSTVANLAGSGTVVTVRVDTGVGSVGDARAVRTVSTLGSLVGARGSSSAAGVVAVGASGGGSATKSGAVSASGSGGVARIASGSSTVGVSSHVAAVVAVRVDTRVGLVQQVGVVRAIGLGGRAIKTTVGALGAEDTTLLDTSASVVGRLMDASGMVGRLMNSSGVKASRLKTSGGRSSTVVAVRVNARVGSIGNAAAVGALSTFGVRHVDDCFCEGVMR